MTLPATAPASVTPMPARAAPVPGPYRPPAPAGRASPRRAIWVSFALMVLLPLAAIAVYLQRFAADQFASTVAFSVRQEEPQVPLEFLGSMGGIGAGQTSDADVIHAFLQSQDLVAAIDRAVDLRAAFSGPWPDDRIFALSPDATIEDLVDHWGWMTRLSHDAATGLIELRVHAFDPETARDIAAAAFEASNRLINQLSDIAQADTLDEAEHQAALAEDRLSQARAALMAFRAETQIVDPGADLGGQMGILGHFEAELADEMVRLDLLTGQTHAGDPRIARSRERIAAIEARIAGERAKLGAGVDGGDTERDYAAVMADFERLNVEVEFATEAYIAARSALVAAEAEARSQSRYLAAHIKPTLAERRTAPDPAVILGVGGVILILCWGVLALVVASLRERA